MTGFGEHIGWLLSELRTEAGSTVKYDGVDYPCVTEEVTPAKVGAQKLPLDALGPLQASIDARVFRLSPRHFAPWTARTPPTEGAELEWHGLRYYVTNATFSDVAESTTAVLLYAYRKVV